MVNNNDLINLVNNKKPVELVQEIDNKYEVPSFEEFMKTYEGGNVNYDDLSGGSVGEIKGSGPCTDGRNRVYCYCSRKETNIQITNNTYNVYISNPSTERIFRLNFEMWNEQDFQGRRWGKTAVFHNVNEAVRSVANIVAGQVDSVYGHDWTNDGGWFFSDKFRPRFRREASIALQSAIQFYQGGTEINGWLRVEDKGGDRTPKITWDYSCGTGENGGSLREHEKA